jgi:hypothetical protein
MTDPNDTALAVLEDQLANWLAKAEAARATVTIAEAAAHAIEGAIGALKSAGNRTTRQPRGEVETTILNHLSANRCRAEELIKTFPSLKSASIISALNRLIAKGTLTIDGSPDHGTYSLARKDAAE